MLLSLAVIVIFINKQDSSEGMGDIVQTTDNPLGVSVNNDTHPSNSSESVVAVEQDVIEVKVDALAQQEHYDSNVEQLGRDKQYDRTSYYDEPIGHIRAKGVGIDEIIYAGASELNMRRGVATVEYLEQLSEHTVAIAGHRSNRPNQYFAGAVYLTKGDKVTVDTFKAGTEDVSGSTDYYVEKVYKVMPEDVYVLEETKRDERKLVLITCATYDPETGKYLERWIVEAYTK